MWLNFGHLHVGHQNMTEKASEVHVLNSAPLCEAYVEAEVVHQQFSTSSLHGCECSPSYPLGPTLGKYLYEFQNNC
jgi:hypothetical protein